MALSRSKLFAGVLVLATAACGSDTTGPGDQQQREIKAAPSFADDINEMIQRKGCSSGNCHGAPGGRAGMMLTADAANNYAQWVNVDAQSEPFKRVLPNDATNSYVVIKVENRQTVGSQMPLTGTQLDNIDLTNLKNWINNGAPNN